ncbi:Hypothetical protein EfmE4453_1402, partial [Enterococcus faecium E4453]
GYTFPYALYKMVMCDFFLFVKIKKVYENETKLNDYDGHVIKMK